jgi:hypothetical protein
MYPIIFWQFDKSWLFTYVLYLVHGIFNWLIFGGSSVEYSMDTLDSVQYIFHCSCTNMSNIFSSKSHFVQPNVGCPVPALPAVPAVPTFCTPVLNTPKSEDMIYEQPLKIYNLILAIWTYKIIWILQRTMLNNIKT